jgi:hypothetical protein
MFINGFKGLGDKQHLLVHNNRLRNKALNQNLKPKTAMVAPGPPTTLSEVWPGDPR